MRGGVTTPLPPLPSALQAGVGGRMRFQVEEYVLAEKYESTQHDGGPRAITTRLKVRMEIATFMCRVSWYSALSGTEADLLIEECMLETNGRVTDAALESTFTIPMS